MDDTTTPADELPRDHGWHGPSAPEGGHRVAQAGEPHIGWIVAGCCAAAAVIHFAMVPVHASASLLDPVAFAIVGWLQLAAAIVILTGRDNRRVYEGIAVLNAVVVSLWIASRTVGLPLGAHKGIVEPVAALDLACAVLEVVAIAISVRLVLHHERPRYRPLLPAVVAVAALGLATTVIASPDASSHSSTKTVDATTALKQEIDATRCDKGFNIPAYWKEAKALDVDTYQGGALAAAAPAASGAVNESAPHNHTASGASVAGGTTTTTTPDPTQGRGSYVLDQLVTDTDQAQGGEGAAAKLVIDLSEAPDREYRNWLWWLRGSGYLSHAHTAGPSVSGDGSGHGGHVGPQLWTALTDQAQCDRLGRELAVARRTALKYPTVADAKKGGYVQVTSYVPGIAAHFMKFDLVDGRFEIDKPEMILYDGTADSAHVVGLSYYIWHEGNAEPTQGFTGANDHGHRHQGLCQGPSGVIGDSTMTAEECAAIGGHKADGSQAWMYHAWVVPGCESPWGVFSAASPILDSQLQRNPVGPGCAGSSVRQRYDLPKPPPPTAQDKKLQEQWAENDRKEKAAQARREAEQAAGRRNRRGGRPQTQAAATPSDKPTNLRKGN